MERDYTTRPSYTVFAKEIYNGDIDEFIAKLRISSQTNGMSADSASLAKFAARAGQPAAAAVKLLGHFQTEAQLDNMPPEILEMIAENMSDPTHVRNLSSTNKDFRDVLSPAAKKAGNRVPFTNITSTLIQRIKTKFGADQPDQAAAKIETIEKKTAGQFYALFDTLSFDRFDWFGKIREFANPASDIEEPQFELPYDDLEVFYEKAADLLRLPVQDIYDSDVVKADIDELISVLDIINSFNAYRNAPAYRSDIIREIEDYEPTIRKVALNRVRAYVNYASFCMSQISRFNQQNRTFQEKENFKKALYHSDEINRFAVGRTGPPKNRDIIMGRGLAPNSSSDLLDADLLRDFLQAGSFLDKEYKALCKQALAEASLRLFGWPNSGQTLRYWLEPLAIEWLLAFPRYLDPTRPLSDQVGEVARAIGLYFILQKVAPHYIEEASHFDTPNDITQGFPTVTREIRKFLLLFLGKQRDAYVPLWWKQKHLRIIMVNHDRLTVSQVEQELQKVYNLKIQYG